MIKINTTVYFLISLLVFGIATALTIVDYKANGYFNPVGISSDRDYIRSERLASCYKAYMENKERVDKVYIHKQDPVVRCSVYMGLIYAMESGYGKSTRCTQDYNCYGLKSGGFLKFKSPSHGNDYFADKYFTYHFNKNAHRLIYGYWNNKKQDWEYGWSRTHRKEYVNFINSKYWDLYGEMEELYGKIKQYIN